MRCVNCHNSKLLLYRVRFIRFGFCLLYSKLDSLGHSRWEKQHHETIHFTRNCNHHAVLSHSRRKPNKISLYSIVNLWTCTSIGFHPGRVKPASFRASNMVLIEEDTLGFDWGKGPKGPTQKNALFAADFSTDALTERPEAAGCRNRHLLDFHQSPIIRVAALIPLGARPIRLGWPYQEPKFPMA